MIKLGVDHKNVYTHTYAVIDGRGSVRGAKTDSIREGLRGKDGKIIMSTRATEA